MYVNTVELRWLELEGTVKMCSSYRKFEPPRSRNFRKKNTDLKNESLRKKILEIYRSQILFTAKVKCFLFYFFRQRFKELVDGKILVSFVKTR